MKIFSSGYTIYNNEEEAHTAVLNQLKSYRTDCVRWSKYVSDIQEKIKKEKQGVRHIFYYHFWYSSMSQKPSITSFSYLEREIGVDNP